ncbi:MAG: ferredoxin-type protein NapF [Helicobacteraceae bacterium]|nr:ferredoxin-type protein NapF [Helicobacteraceae bacterium]
MRHIFKKNKNIILPYCKDSKILESCLQCEDSPCINICDEKIIKKEESEISLDFSSSGCTFCAKCADICKEKSFGLLDLGLGDNIFANINLDKNKCLAWNKTLCRYCLDICDKKSIKFIGDLYPQINETCNKCGFCISVCPTYCINIF